MERAQRGELDAFATITAAISDRAYATAKLVLRDDDLAADAVQDALLQAWLDMRALRDAERFEAWFHRLLVRACYRMAGRRRRRTLIEVQAPTDVHPTILDTQHLVAAQDQIERAFGRLPTDQRAVLVLRHYVGLSQQEIADVLGVPLGTAQSRLARATQAMRAALDADDRPIDLATEGAR